jgi:hypothetical protein
VIRYNQRTGDHTLGTANIVVFLVIWAGLETNHQYRIRKGIEIRAAGENLLISVREFNRRISDLGLKLVILDDLVLDFSNYDHPGGD